jgi:hypothetical protein
MTYMSVDHDQDPEDVEPRYAYKPSLVSAPCEFVLKPDALHWQVGRRSGRVRYDRVRSVRLSFRPLSMQWHRFITEIRAPDNPNVLISSTSWRSLVEQERLDGAYTAFVSELHQRLTAAGSAAQFHAGMRFLPYWIGIVVFAGVLLATAAMVVRAIQIEQWSGAAVVALFFAVFAFQLGNYFRRNRPTRYRPDALPDQVLPAAPK